jgi:integrase
MAKIEKTPTGYRSRVYWKGKQYSTRVCRSEAEVPRAIEDLRVDLRTGEYFENKHSAEAEAYRQSAANQSPRFDKFAQQWLQRRRPGEVGGYQITTWHKRRTELVELKEHFATYKLRDITPLTVQLWWDGMHDKPSRRKSLYYVLKAIFRHAEDLDLIVKSPCRVRGAGEDVSAPRPDFTFKDVQRLHSAAEDEVTRALILFSVGAGTRIGEALALDWSDIDLLESDTTLAKRLTPFGILDGLKAQKRGRRYTALPEWALSAILELRKGMDVDDDGPIFRNAYGNRMSIDVAERRLRKARAKANVEGIRLHDMRHISLTSFWDLEGANEKEVLARGGHAGLSAAQKYWHGNPEAQKKLARSLPNPITT